MAEEFVIDAQTVTLCSVQVTGAFGTEDFLGGLSTYTA
jgi:hypothetical protein